MQCNALIIKTTAKQVWLYFIRKATRPGYTQALRRIFRLFGVHQKIANLIPRLNQTTKKKIPTPKIPGIEHLKPQKIPRASLSLEIRSIPPPPGYFTGARSVLLVHIRDSASWLVHFCYCFVVKLAGVWDI